MDEKSDRELFDRIAARYSQKDRLPASSIPRRAQLLFALEEVLPALGPDAAIVDVGCGIGAAARYLQGRYRRYLGIDHSPEMVRIAREFNRGNERAEFVVGSISELPPPCDRVDLVMADGALHHMADPSGAVAAMASWGKPGAHLIVREPCNHNPLFQLLRRLRRLLDPDYSHQQVFFSARELLAAFRRCGLDDCRVDYFGFFSTPFAQVRLPLQPLTAPLSRLCTRLDLGLSRSLPRFLRRYAFNVVLRGRIAGPSLLPGDLPVDQVGQ